MQSEFNNLFPYLKLEFYKCQSGKITAAPDSVVSPEIYLFTLTRLLKPGGIYIEFSELTTVKELERQIWKQTGIHVRVFRQFGKTWLPTMLTAEWTLQLQNEEGAIMANSPG